MKLKIIVAQAFVYDTDDWELDEFDTPESTIELFKEIAWDQMQDSTPEFIVEVV